MLCFCSLASFQWQTTKRLPSILRCTLRQHRLCLPWSFVLVASACTGIFLLDDLMRVAVVKHEKQIVVGTCTCHSTECIWNWFWPTEVEMFDAHFRNIFLAAASQPVWQAYSCIHEWIQIMFFTIENAKNENARNKCLLACNGCSK